MELTQAEYRLLYNEFRENLCTEDCLCLAGWRGQLHPSTARKIRIRNQRYLDGHPDDKQTRFFIQTIIHENFPDLILLPF